MPPWGCVPDHNYVQLLINPLLDTHCTKKKIVVRKVAVEILSPCAHQHLLPPPCYESAYSVLTVQEKD